MGDSGRVLPASLLERDAELDALRAAVAEVAAGGGRVTLIEGGAGIGKSRLLAETRGMAVAAGFRVLPARGDELEREYGFGLVRQLFEPVVSAARTRWLTGPASGAAPAFGVPRNASEPALGNVSFAVLNGLHRLTVSLAADGPLLLLVDDLHWSDRPSLRFLAYLAPRLAGLPILLAAALHPAEPGVDARLLNAAVHDATAVFLQPRPLSEAAVARLVGERLGVESDRPFAAACHRATGGNPQLLTELLRAMRAERLQPDAAHADAVAMIGPRAVTRTVLLRLLRLPDDAVEVARTAAVLGEGAGTAAIAALTGISEAAVAAATRVLVGAEVLRPEPPLGFVHPLVRDAIYHELSPGEREVRHARAARLLLAAGTASEQVAAHLLVVTPRHEDWVVAVLRDAARTAVRAGAADSAVAYLRRALQEPPAAALRPDLLRQLGTAEALVDAPAAVEHLTAAYGTLADPRARAVTADLLTRMLIFTRPPEEAAAVARRAAREAPDELADQRQALEAMELYAVHFGAPDTRTAQRLSRVHSGVKGGSAGARMLLAVAAWDRALAGGSAAECVKLAREALADGVLIAADPGFMAIVAAGVLVLADQDETVRVWDAMLAESQRQGSLFAVTGVHLWQGWTWLQRGALGDAESCLRLAIEESRLYNPRGDAGMPYAVAFLVRVLLERGDLAAARAAMAESGAAAPASDGDASCLRSTVELLLAEGRHERAVEAADTYAARLRRVVNPGWAPWRSLKAEALRQLGLLAEARQLLEEELVLAQRWGAPGTIAQTLRGLGALGGERGLDLLREAVAVTADSPARIEHAKALAALGAGLRRAHRPGEARLPLRQAVELASMCGAQQLAAQARAELAAAGGRLRGFPLTGVRSLTPSERRVADLAAAGRSNRDIAQTLYVTPKTVEIHLSSTYRKLGIRSRTALPGALGGAV